MDQNISSRKIRKLLKLARENKVQEFYSFLWDFAGYGFEETPNTISQEILNTLHLFKSSGRTIDLNLYRRFNRADIKCPLPKDKCIIYYADDKWSKFYQCEKDNLMHIDFWYENKWHHNIDQVHFPEIEEDVVRFAYKIIYVCGLGATVQDINWSPDLSSPKSTS